MDPIIAFPKQSQKKASKHICQWFLANLMTNTSDLIFHINTSRSSIQPYTPSSSSPSVSVCILFPFIPWASVNIFTKWQRAKSFTNKEIKSHVKWRWRPTSILHKPNGNEERTKRHANLQARHEPHAEVIIASSLKAKSMWLSAAVPDAVWIMHDFQTQFGHSTQKDKGMHYVHTFISIQDVMWVSFVMLNHSEPVGRPCGKKDNHSLRGPEFKPPFWQTSLRAEVSLSCLWRVQSHWKQI